MSMNHFRIPLSRPLTKYGLKLGRMHHDVMLLSTNPVHAIARSEVNALYTLGDTRCILPTALTNLRSTPLTHRFN